MKKHIIAVYSEWYNVVHTSVSSVSGRASSCTGGCGAKHLSYSSRDMASSSGGGQKVVGRGGTSTDSCRVANTSQYSHTIAKCTQILYGIV